MFVEGQPFSLVKVLFSILVNLVQIFLHLLSNCFQKGKKIADPVILNFKMCVHNLTFCWL